MTGDQVVIEELAIEDHPGDGLKTYGVNGLTIRNVKVEWTVKGRAENGSYGFYPVMSENILIENTHIIGASDAGIYVGQSKNIIVRNNLAEYNVAELKSRTHLMLTSTAMRYATTLAGYWCSICRIYLFPREKIRASTTITSMKIILKTLPLRQVAWHSFRREVGFYC